MSPGSDPRQDVAASRERTRWSLLVHYAQGLLMGSADVIPGVSGGTMALVVGIYQRLVESISSAFSLVLSLVRGDMAAVRTHVLRIEWKLIIPLAVGIASGIVIVVQFIPFLLETYPQQMRGLFLGLVAASIAVPWMRIGRVTIPLLALAILMGTVAFVLVGLPLLAPRVDPGLLRVLLSAMLAISAMILPGVSGAFLLEVLGMYRPTTEALTAALALDAAAVLYVATFLLGAAVGLGVFSKALGWLLANYHDHTMAALVGLMAGSLRALWPWQRWELDGRSLRLPGEGDPLLTVIALMAVGLIFVGALTWLAARRARANGEPSSIG